MNKVFLGLPSYGGIIGEKTLGSFLNATKQNLIGAVKVQGFSILTHNFNMLYASALNARKDGITHFCLLHSDVVPDDGWLDKLVALADMYKADVMSVILPIKDGRGLTSTAIETEDKWHPHRLSLKEIYDKAATFTDEKILVNSGLMLIDIRKPWAEELCFRFEDSIVKDDKGMFQSQVCPEDWLFSRDAAARGARIYATREIKAIHVGQAHYSNAFVWGLKE